MPDDTVVRPTNRKFHIDFCTVARWNGRELLLAADHKPLIAYESQLGSEAELAVPNPHHYLPLLYIGTRTASEPVAFPVEGVDGGSVSMLAVQVG